MMKELKALTARVAALEKLVKKPRTRKPAGKKKEKES